MFKGSLVDPRLRASNEHIPIVRIPRAGGRLGYPSHPFEAARCASTEDHQASSPSLFREHRTNVGVPSNHFPPPFLSGSLDAPPLRTSRKHSFIMRPP